MIVTLIGYRGSGKTSVAAPLAKRLGWDWIDADAEIERVAGCSIRQIFARGGEKEFRRLEREVLTELLQRDRLVIASGGGAVLNANTRREFREAGPVVWLCGAPDTLLARLQRDDSTTERRPQLTDLDQRREVETLLEQRTPLYRQCASVIVQTDGLTIDQIVDVIADGIQVNGNPDGLRER